MAETATDASTDPQPQPQQATDPSTSTTVEQVNDKTTKTTTVTTGTDVSTAADGTTTTKTTETTNVEERTAYDQQRVLDPTLPQGTEELTQEGHDAVTADQTVKTTTTTEKPFNEQVYRLVDGRDAAYKDDNSLHRVVKSITRRNLTNGTTLKNHRVIEGFRYALVNVNNPNDVRFSDWDAINYYSMTLADDEGEHQLTGEAAENVDPNFYKKWQAEDGVWRVDPEELLAALKAKELGYDGTNIRVLEGEEPTADEVAAILRLNGAGNERTSDTARTAALVGMVGTDGVDDGWHFSADGKSLMRTVVTVETMPTVTVPGQDEIISYNPAAPAEQPTGPKTPSTPAEQPTHPASDQVVAPAAQQLAAPAVQVAPAQAAQTNATPQTSDNLGAFAGVVAVLPAALGVLAMALLKRRRA